MPLPTIDAYAPREIARKIEAVGVTKARNTLSLLVLAVLAGAFIALGALFFIVVVTRATLGFGVSRLVGAWPLAWDSFWLLGPVCITCCCLLATALTLWLAPRALLAPMGESSAGAF